MFFLCLVLNFSTCFNLHVRCKKKTNFFLEIENKCRYLFLVFLSTQLKFERARMTPCMLFST